MNLDDLGWTPALDFHFSELGEITWQPCRVSRVDRGRAMVIATDGERPAAWRSPIPIVGAAPVDAPAIGDWCAASQHRGLLRIEAILPRSTLMSRGVSSGGRATQILAANVDVAFVVTGLDGDFSLRRIERFLVLARSGGVRPVVVLNKADLCDQVESRADAVRDALPGVAVLTLTAPQDDVGELVRQELGSGQSAVFLGSSGVGKSTIINRLLGEDRQATAPVRADDDRGRHTTTRRELILLPGGRAVIDTPGLRAVGVLGDDEGLDSVFADIAKVAEGCRFRDCRHEGEPGCAVAEAVASGTLTRAHVDSYLRLRRESENAALRQDAYACRQQERRTVGHYKRWLRESQRLKGR